MAADIPIETKRARKGREARSEGKASVLTLGPALASPLFPVRQASLRKQFCLRAGFSRDFQDKADGTADKLRTAESHKNRAPTQKISAIHLNITSKELPLRRLSKQDTQRNDDE